MTSNLQRCSLNDSISEVSSLIRAQPLDASHRRALAYLRLVKGDYAGALQQLQVAVGLDASLSPEAQLLRMLVQAERLRTAAFRGSVFPDLMLPAPEWLNPLLMALRAEAPEARALRESALDAAPAPHGHTEHTGAFASFSDGDERIGPVLEVMVGGGYHWLPISSVASFSVQPPGRLPDLLWAPVHITLTNGIKRTGFMPARYPLPEDVELSDSELLYGHRTEWTATKGAGWEGLGRRCWIVDGEMHSLFEVGTVELQTTTLSTPSTGQPEPSP